MSIIVRTKLNEAFRFKGNESVKIIVQRYDKLLLVNSIPYKVLG